MKTITEFFGMSLKTIAEKVPGITAEATTTATEALKAEGKSEEEMAAALPEAIKAAVAAKFAEQKLEGDKLAMCLAAIEVAKGVRGNLKRIVVMTGAEGEKAPAGAKEIDGKFYVAELFPEAARAAPKDDRGDRFGGKGKRDGKGGKGGRDGKGRGDGERAPRGDRPERAQTPSNGVVIAVKAGGAGVAPGHVAVPQGDRPARAPRPAKKPRAPVEPYKGPNRIMLAGSTPAANTESAAEAPSSEATSDGSST